MCDFSPFKCVETCIMAQCLAFFNLTVYLRGLYILVQKYTSLFLIAHLIITNGYFSCFIFYLLLRSDVSAQESKSIL